MRSTGRFNKIWDSGAGSKPQFSQNDESISKIVEVPEPLSKFVGSTRRQKVNLSPPSEVVSDEGLSPIVKKDMDVLLFDSIVKDQMLESNSKAYSPKVDKAKT